MQVHFGIGLLKVEWKQAVVCLGTFDGVHLGHQAVIRQAVQEAREKELPCVVVTFDRHPAAILAPSRCPKSIASLSENLESFEKLEVSAAVVLAFDAELSRTSADVFLRQILVGALNASSLVVGHDFAMGNGREGTTDWLTARIPTTVVPPFEVDGVRVSSSQIRLEVEEGDMSSAAKLLGRPFAIGGVVVTGQKLGRELGFPTANIARTFDHLTPANGIYAGRLRFGEHRYTAAVSIGTRPAVGGEERTIEAYLLDYPGGSLYGAPVELDLVYRLREERNFPNLDDLTRQIAMDVEETRRLMISA